jgi:hypothetical protein
MRSTGDPWPPASPTPPAPILRDEPVGPRRTGRPRMGPAPDRRWAVRGDRSAAPSEHGDQRDRSSRLDLPSSYDSIGTIDTALRELLADTSLDGLAEHRISVAVREVVANAIEHGNHREPVRHVVVAWGPPARSSHGAEPLSPHCARAATQ